MIPAARRKSLLALFSLVLLATGIFVLPYAVPMQPAVSLSYVTGFNNHTALFFFVGAGLLFAYFNNGIVAPVTLQDRKLPPGLLWAGVAMTALACISFLLHRAHANLGFGQELYYMVDRQYHLDAGQRPYRDFEFSYGPLLLYPGHWFHTLLHVSGLRGYLMAWVANWIAGAAMIGFLMAKIELPTRHRALLLFFFLACMMSALRLEGLNYTPLRFYCAAFLCVAVHVFWRRFRRPYGTAILMAAAVALGFAVSAGQGVGLLLGLCAYTLLLAWYEPALFPRGAAILALGLAAAVLLVVQHFGLLSAAQSFSHGGLNLPLLPSPANLFLLSIYLCGMGPLVRALRGRDIENVAVPLALCGLPMLSAAFGRCDTGHLSSATPLALAGVFAISTIKWPFRAWLLISCLFFVDFSLVLARLLPRSPVTSHASVHHGKIDPTLQGKAIEPGRVYFAPAGAPFNRDGSLGWGADTGYSFGLATAGDSRALEAKRDEIIRRRAPWLLLPESNGKIHFSYLDWGLDELHLLEKAAWVPPPRHPLPDIGFLSATVQEMYTPTDEIFLPDDKNQDSWRVWHLR